MRFDCLIAAMVAGFLVAVPTGSARSQTVAPDQTTQSESQLSGNGPR